MRVHVAPRQDFVAVNIVLAKAISVVEESRAQKLGKQFSSALEANLRARQRPAPPNVAHSMAEMESDAHRNAQWLRRIRKVRKCLGVGTYSPVFEVTTLKGQKRALKLGVNKKEVDVARLVHEDDWDVIDTGANLHMLMPLYTTDIRTYFDIMRERVEETPKEEVDEALEDFFLDLITVYDQVHDQFSLIHDAGLVHRDIHGKNIMIGETDEGELVATLIDFGLARKVECPSRTLPRFRNPETFVRSMRYHDDYYAFNMVVLDGVAYVMAGMASRADRHLRKFAARRKQFKLVGALLHDMTRASEKDDEKAERVAALQLATRLGVKASTPSDELYDKAVEVLYDLSFFNMRVMRKAITSTRSAAGMKLFNMIFDFFLA
ncbi:MAG: hypothetical protein KVP17_003498 [Porospora cf. gigantea B]|uniref:uncharacterized protein n=1 Tax=Porospora cf. gigantea B TaxID=2853592 RepID=UPI003571BEDB|nr:MAG: hypothetical protein KVP17_003498 [Porospora cf. gigantea B]